MNVNVNRTRDEICLLSLFAFDPSCVKAAKREATRKLVADHIIALAPSVAVTRECVG
jgi:hypothetical protein